MVNSNKHIIKLFITIVLIGAQICFSQRIKVPVEVQLKIIPKILSLNKNFLFNESQKYLSTSILYSSDQRNSMQVFEDFTKKEEPNLHPFDLARQTNFKKFIRENEIKVVYITPIRGVDISEITKICKEENILTITGVEEYKVNDVIVILDLEDNKVQIIINQKSAKMAGVNFSSRLLKIAQVIN